MPLDEVVGALGRRGERHLGLQTIPLDTIIGTVEPRRDFDRRFRPTSNRVRFRWERLALAQRRGEPIPPIEVYRVGDLHFVTDGHHRVSIAAATGQRHDRRLRDRGAYRRAAHEQRAPGRPGPDPGPKIGPQLGRRQQPAARSVAGSWVGRVSWLW